jgi:outer membrane protein assembly factor BamB
MRRFSLWGWVALAAMACWLSRTAADEGPKQSANPPPAQQTVASPPAEPLAPSTQPPANATPQLPGGESEPGASSASGDGHEPTAPPPKIADPVALTTKEGKKGWKLAMPGGRPLATPAVVEGKLYIGGGFGSYEFYAFDARSGKMLWQHRTTDDGPTAAVVADGCVIFNTESCELEVLGLDGKPKWKKWLGDPLMSMPGIAEGRLLMAFPDSRGDREHYLACFDLKTGDEHWRKKIAGEIITAPTIDDRQVFLATLDGTLYAFHIQDGALAWVEKERNATSSPTLAGGRLWFSRRSEATLDKAGKKVKQQMEQVAGRGLAAKAEVRDLASTTRKADYLDYGLRAGYGMGAGMGGMAAPSKEGAQQKADAGVGFAGGGDEPPAANAPVQGGGQSPKNPPVPQQPPAPLNAPSPAPVQTAPGGGKGDSKMFQAQANLGQGSVNGVWSYQGSKPLFYEGKIYASMGDTLLCVDPRTEKVLWKKESRPPKDDKAKDKTPPKKVKDKTPSVQEPGEDAKLLLDAIISPPALCNHKVFIGTGSGEVICLRADTGKPVWTATIGGSIVFQPVVAEGRVYVSTESGALCCIETGDPQDDGWLMWGANAAHTGAARAAK